MGAAVSRLGESVKTDKTKKNEEPRRKQRGIVGAAICRPRNGGSPFPTKERRKRRGIIPEVIKVLLDKIGFVKNIL